MHLMTGKLNLNNVIMAVIDRPCIFGCHPSVNFVDSSPQWEPYGKPLLEERWHEVTEWWLFRNIPLLSISIILVYQNGRPMVAPTDCKQVF